MHLNSFGHYFTFLNDREIFSYGIPRVKVHRVYFQPAVI